MLLIGDIAFSRLLPIRRTQQRRQSTIEKQSAVLAADESRSLISLVERFQSFLSLFETGMTVAHLPFAVDGSDSQLLDRKVLPATRTVTRRKLFRFWH